MSVPVDIENERIEIKDDEGNRLVFRPVAIIGNEETMYYVFGATKILDDGQTRQMRLMLMRREEQEDGTSRYVICDSEKEVEQIIGSFLRQAIGEIARKVMADQGEEAEAEEPPECGFAHAPGEFCYCAQPEYLQ